MPTVLIVVIGLLAAWALAVAVIVHRRPSGPTLAETMRLLPDTARLLRRLATDPATPRAIRIRLWATVIYLAVPIDLVPDFLPGLGHADDVLIVGWSLRAAIRHSEPDLIRRLWPGTTEGLDRLLQLVGG